MFYFKQVALISTAMVFASRVAAQTPEYEVTIIPRPAGAGNSVPNGLNNSGVVVGWSQFGSPGPYLAGWRWTASDGLEILPPPPGSMHDRYAARDINDAGVILGDGGGDSGFAWKLENGTYTILGTLAYAPYNASVGAGINGLGEVVGNAFDSNHFTVARKAFLHTDATGLLELFPDLPAPAAGGINDAGQIVVTAGSGTFRMEPNGTRTFLPVPVGFFGINGAVISGHGDVAGVVGCSHECNQAFLYTDWDGMQVIPWVGTRHYVAGVNNSLQVVGGVTEGVARGWIWTKQDGIRFLTSLIDPDLTLLVVHALGINERGQIIAAGLDYTVPFDNRRVMLLTPFDAPPSPFSRWRARVR